MFNVLTSKSPFKDQGDCLHGYIFVNLLIKVDTAIKTTDFPIKHAASPIAGFYIII